MKIFLKKSCDYLVDHDLQSEITGDPKKFFPSLSSKYGEKKIPGSIKAALQPTGGCTPPNPCVLSSMTRKALIHVVN